VDLEAVERELCRIPDVRSARIVADEHGDPIEVHVLAAPGKGAKQIVRDVQSVAIASAGLDIDHRIISVVQLESAGRTTIDLRDPPALDPAPEPEEPVEGDSTRIVIERVVESAIGTRATVSVGLRRGDESVVGAGEGMAAARSRWRIVAEATLDGLRRLEPAAEDVAIEVVGIQWLGDRRICAVTLTLVAGRAEELLAGIAPVGDRTEGDSVARAVLDATNRRLALLR
jgi:hypothetical protein